MNCDIFWSRSEKGIFVIFFHNINSLVLSKKESLKGQFLGLQLLQWIFNIVDTQYPLHSQHINSRRRTDSYVTHKTQHFSDFYSELQTLLRQKIVSSSCGFRPIKFRKFQVFFKLNAPFLCPRQQTILQMQPSC